MAFPVVASSPGFASTDALREVWDLSNFENAEVAVGTALINNDRPAVAYTPSGGHVAPPKTVGLVTVSGFPDGGVGLGPKEVSVAVDGTWEFPVTGVTGSTDNGTKVYATVASGKITELNLTASGNKLFGVINQPQGIAPSAAKACVKIGAGL